MAESPNRFPLLSKPSARRQWSTLSRLTRDLDGRILAKLEYLNPGFSKKDRIARADHRGRRSAGPVAAGRDRGQVHQRQHRDRSALAVVGSRAIVSWP